MYVIDWSIKSPCAEIYLPVFVLAGIKLIVQRYRYRCDWLIDWISVFTDIDVIDWLNLVVRDMDVIDWLNLLVQRHGGDGPWAGPGRQPGGLSGPEISRGLGQHRRHQVRGREYFIPWLIHHPILVYTLISQRNIFNGATVLERFR